MDAVGSSDMFSELLEDLRAATSLGRMSGLRSCMAMMFRWTEA